MLLYSMQNEMEKIVLVISDAYQRNPTGRARSGKDSSWGDHEIVRR